MLEKNTCYVIIINYNNWKDTIVCVENLIQHKIEHSKIIIIDNASTDDSSAKIKEYLAGKLDAVLTEIYPIHEKELFIEKKDYSIIHEIENNAFDIKLSKINLYSSPKNGGFAYGNNLGVKISKLDINYKNGYLWFLNNDTFIDQDALQNLIIHFHSKNFGLIGSKILNYDSPHEIQSICGKLNRYKGKIIVCKNENDIDKMNYPIGASLFTSTKIFDEVGFFDETYFLYFEEIDYSNQILKHGYNIGVALNSIVYHKQGATTGSSKKIKLKNLFIESFKYKGLIKLYKKHYPNLILIAYFYLAMRALKQLLKGNRDHFKLIVNIIFTNPSKF